MKYTLLKTGLFLLLGVFIISCNKNDENTEESENFDDLVISPSFIFESTKKVTANFEVVTYLKDENRHVISIYQGDPAKGGHLLNKGITNTSYNYSVSFKLPERIESIFVENRNSDGIYELVEIPLIGNTINYTFNTKEYFYPEKATEKCIVVNPDCEQCNHPLSGSYSSLTLDGKDYCVIEGSSLAVTNQLIFKNGATLTICGNASFRDIQVQNNRGEIWISATGVANTAGDLNINNKVNIYNFGIYNISGNLNTRHSCDFINHGDLNIAGSVNNNTNYFSNDGVVEISGHFNGNSGSNFENYGTAVITGHANINSGAIINNYCHLHVVGNINNNHKIYNHSYIKSDNTFTINGGAKLYISSNSLVKTKNLMVNGTVRGDNNQYGKIMISDNTTINGSGKVFKLVDLCDEGGDITNNGTIANTVVFCEITIPQDACNPGSGGGSAGTDTDGDGVVDEEDAFPEDPERAFISYYPNEIDFASVAYEDLWPGVGDYDFNDLVVNFNYEIVTNADNLIVDIIAQTNVAAAGASLNNGFGLSIPVEPSRCASVTGTVNVEGTLDINPVGYENGHPDNTVIIFYDAINSIYNSAMFNTIPDGNTVETDTITVTVYFDNPQIPLGSEPYNPFIYVDQERGKEIHLIDNEPTSLADMSYFGTWSDNSDPTANKWYLTDKYLPWAVETPSNFDYPIEKTDILSAYLKFKEWAESSGNVYENWYLDQPGYRNENNIYQKDED